MSGRGAIADFERALGHRFAEPDRLERALTHASASTAARPDNERLEFLGDRVLGLVIAEALLEAFPGDEEGDLAPRLNTLVRRETLAEIAVELGLGPHLRLGRSEAMSGGRRKAAILADAMEALIAALYRDGGLEIARRFVLSAWGPRLEAVSGQRADAKTRIQEWAQARGLAPPSYRLIERTGPDHKPEFTMEAALDDGRAATGCAASKKLAEQAAATALLARLEASGESESEAGL